MKTLAKLAALTLLTLSPAKSVASQPFEGAITATLTWGDQITPLLYTMGTNRLRVEVTATDRPHSVDILDRDSDVLSLLFPHNRSFVRLQPSSQNEAAAPPGFPAIPPMPMPAGVGPQAQVPGSTPAAIGPTNLPAMPNLRPPQMPQPPLLDMPAPPPSIGPHAGFGGPGMVQPMMLPIPMQPAELKAMGDTTNLLGYSCTHYEIKQRGQVMDIWATDKLLPFQPYLQNQPRRFGPQMIEERWGELLKAKKLFPLLAMSRFETPPGQTGTAPAPPGPERLRFEVKSITPEKIRDQTLFEPPPDYHEVQPLPF